MVSVLATDGYKLSMAEAGWPLRRETFHYSHRRGGPQLVPFDVERELRALCPAPVADDYAFLLQHEYELGAGFKAAIARAGELSVQALPKGAVFFGREPVFSVTGPSALVSWLEPLLLQWSYRIQVATLAWRAPHELAAAVGVVTCERQKALALEAIDFAGVQAPPIRVDEAGYVARVKAQVDALAQVTGSPARLFEVGLRAASCMDQHLLALAGCKAAGLTRTSNAYGAKLLGLTPVGTMGHEHVQRYGSDDAAFRAMTERRPQRSSFLLDTFDTLASGLPAALRLIAERPNEKDSIRYDSGDKELQYREAVRQAKALGVRPVHILEDGFDVEQTARFEVLRRELGVEPQEQVYGYGGYLVARTSGSPLTRDRVAAVYKLSQTGHSPTMKFGNEAGSGKQSIPGRPVLFRRVEGDGPLGVVGQEGEVAPRGYRQLTGAAALPVPPPASVGEGAAAPALSEATAALVAACTAKAFAGRAA